MSNDALTLIKTGLPVVPDQGDVIQMGGLEADLLDETVVVRKNINDLRETVSVLETELASSIASAVPASSPSPPSARYHLAGLTAWFRAWTRATISTSPAELADQERHERVRPAVFWASLLAIVVVAFITRVVGLSDIPQGIQGDEAQLGIEARRVLATGSIGPFTGNVGGTPTGMIYLIAGSIRIFGDEFHSIRLTAGLLGLLAVPAFFLALRSAFGNRTALLGAAFFTACGWPILFSRITQPANLWILLVIVAIATLSQAWKTGKPAWHGAAGAALAVGFYAYNGSGPFLITVLPVLAVAYVGWRILPFAAAIALTYLDPGLTGYGFSVFTLYFLLRTPQLFTRQRLVNPVVFSLSFLAIFSWMFNFIRQYPDTYFGVGERHSLFNHPTWTDLPADQHTSFLLHRYVEYWERLSFQPVFNTIDISGVLPMIVPGFLLLAAIGMVLSLLKRRSPLIWIGISVIAFLPIAAVLTSDFAIRRSLAVLPFILMFAAIGASEFVRIAKRNSILWVVTACLVAVISASSARASLDDYFNETVDHRSTSEALSVPMVEAVNFMTSLPPDTYVYMLSDSWQFNYETRRFFAPDLKGEDRSARYSVFSLATNPARPRPVFIMFGTYTNNLAALRARYPGGRVVIGPDEPDPGIPAFIAYFPPPRNPTAPAIAVE